MENIKAVIFDMDGILLDSETISDKTWHIAASVMQLKNIDTILNECRGCNAKTISEKLKSFYGKDFASDVFLEHTSKLFYKIEQEDGIPLMQGAKEALSYLSKKYTIALASSTHKDAVFRQMKNANLFHYFKTITTGDMVAQSKPHPEIYEKACASISLLPSQCVAIEDSPNGIKSAASAGLSCIMIPDKIEPTEEIKNLTQHILPSLKMIHTIL